MNMNINNDLLPAHFFLSFFLNCIIEETNVVEFALAHT